MTSEKQKNDEEKLLQVRDLLKMGPNQPIDIYGNESPGELENLQLINTAYGWSLGDNGRVYALVAGDQGYAPTAIVIPQSHLDAVIEGEVRKALLDIDGGTKAALTKRFRGMDYERQPNGGWHGSSAIGTYIIESDGWTSPLTGKKTPADSLIASMKGAANDYRSFAFSMFKLGEAD